MNTQRLTKKQEIIIGKQLRRNQTKPYAIASFCRYGYPYVILQKMVDDGIVHFGSVANPIWLTCPYMNDVLHDLETEGYINKINELMLGDRRIFSNMRDAHAEFYYFRKELFREQNGQSLAEDMIKFFDLGIGGIKDIQYIKCLHLHYAHYELNKKNTIGLITLELLNKKKYCEDGRCSCLEE